MCSKRLFAGRELIRDSVRPLALNGSVVVRYSESTCLDCCRQRLRRPATGIFLPASSQLRRNMRLGNSWWLYENVKDVLQQMRLDSAFDWPSHPVHVCRKGFRNEVQVISTVLLRCKMHLHQWQLCLGHHQHFLSRYSIWRTYRWGTSRLCWWGNHNPTQEQVRPFWIDRLVLSTLINMVESGAKELSEEIMLEALLKDWLKLLKNYCLPRRNRCGSRYRKSRSRIVFMWMLTCKAEIIAAYNSDLQKRSAEEKLAREAATKQWKIKSQQFTKKICRPRRIWPYNAQMWLKSWNKWNTQKCAVWSQKFVLTAVRSMKSVLWMRKWTSFLRAQVQALHSWTNASSYLNFGANGKRKSSAVWIQSTRNALCTTITSHNNSETRSLREKLCRRPVTCLRACLLSSLQV